MPIYEYQCAACGKTTEVITLASGPGDVVQCAACGSQEMAKKMSAVAIPKMPGRPAGKTCCGRDEKCDSGGSCCCMQ